jgi:uncharacterized protein
LRENFDNVVSPDLPIDPIEVHKMFHYLVQEYIEQLQTNQSEQLIFVGTSLGAFYANYYGQIYDCHYVLINPSINPSKSLQTKLGINVNHTTSEEFILKIAHLDEFQRMQQIIENNSASTLTTLFVAKNDEIIPYQNMIRQYKYTRKTIIVENGGHRFTDNWHLVIDEIKTIINNV